MNGKKVKKNVRVACTACQRRKGKCVGDPCAYCLKNNYVCEFKESQKRGPKVVKLPTDLQKFDLLNHVQEEMGIANLQQNFVDFYFECIGEGIPKKYKTFLLSPTQNNTEMRTQIYIITANIMKVYGNEELETQYITKAYKSSSLFDSDTLESAISLMMMAFYLGKENQKSRNLLFIANNTLSLPSLGESNMVQEARFSCRSCCELFSSNVSNLQRANYFLTNLLPLDPILLAQYACKSDILTVGIACIAALILSKGNLDDTNVDCFLKSIVASFINQEDRNIILEYINKLEISLKSINDPNGALDIYSCFVIEYSRFIVEWRSGSKDSFSGAIKAMDTFMKGPQIIALRSTDKIVSLLLLPFYFREVSAMDLASQLLNTIEESFTSIRKRNECVSIWEGMCGNHSYSIVQLETELLGTP